VLAAGCSHSTVALNNSQPGAPVTGYANTNGAVAAVVLITSAVAAAHDFSDWTSRPVPAMAADREVAEQDCTRPVDLTGNLRCR
jgi:hypothetical protein